MNDELSTVGGLKQALPDKYLFPHLSSIWFCFAQPVQCHRIARIKAGFTSIYFYSSSVLVDLLLNKSCLVYGSDGRSPVVAYRRREEVLAMLEGALGELLSLQGVNFGSWARQVLWQCLRLPKSIRPPEESETESGNGSGGVVDLNATAIIFDPDSSVLLPGEQTDLSFNTTISSVSFCLTFAFICLDLTPLHSSLHNCVTCHAHYLALVIYMHKIASVSHQKGSLDPILSKLSLLTLELRICF